MATTAPVPSTALDRGTSALAIAHALRDTLRPRWRWYIAAAERALRVTPGSVAAPVDWRLVSKVSDARDLSGTTILIAAIGPVDGTLEQTDNGPLGRVYAAEFEVAVSAIVETGDADATFELASVWSHALALYMATCGDLDVPNFRSKRPTGGDQEPLADDGLRAYGSTTWRLTVDEALVEEFIDVPEHGPGPIEPGGSTGGTTDPATGVVDPYAPPPVEPSGGPLRVHLQSSDHPYPDLQEPVP